jgi:hypothetical protein
MSAPPAPPLSRTVRVSEITAGGLALRISTSEAERRALAEAYGIDALHDVSAEVALSPVPGGGFDLTGLVRARMTRTCTVTLEPFEAELEEPIEARFMPAASAPRRKAEVEIEIAYDEADPPEPIVNGTADIGPIVAEFLALGLDPYPRAPGVAFESAVPEAEARPNPFAALVSGKPSTTSQ